MEYYSRKDVEDIIRKLINEPYYYHEGEDFYSGVCAVESEIACLNAYVFDESTASHWKTREDKNDFLWVECSNCGFIVENYQAVNLGKSSTDIVGYKWHACPKCTAKMVFDKEMN